MTSVLAIISKAVFEDEFGDASVGDVLPLGRYTSAHKALAPLADGGQLVLVTVRPPNDSLWLVAVLENPKHKKGAWVAAPNKVASTDLGPVKDQIRFASGAAISAKKGALGMSLQTPRALADGMLELMLGTKASPPVVVAPPVAVVPSAYVAAPKPVDPTWHERVQWIVDHGTVAHFLDERKLLDRACNDDYAAAIGPIVRAIDPVKLLQRQLQGGVLDEFRWPAQEEAAALLGEDVPDSNIAGPFPHAALHNAKQDRIVVIGPDGIEFDQPLKLPANANGIWFTLYVDGDVLVIYKVGEQIMGLWMGDHTPFKAAGIGSRHAVPGVGAVIGDEFPPIARGNTTKKMFEGNSRTVFQQAHRLFRSNRYYAYSDLDTGGRGRGDDRIEQFDPHTGKAGEVGLPPWFAERMHADARLLGASSFLFPVPKRAERSALGAKDGLGALIVRREPDGSIYAEGADGRSWRANVPKRPDPSDPRTGLPRGLMKFPEREGIYPIVYGEDDRWSKMLMPDNRTVLVHWWPHMWAGVPQQMWSHGDPKWLHLYEPRDPAASRRLRDATEDTARALLAAAEPVFAADANLKIDDNVAPMLRPLAKWPALAERVRELFPGFDDRLVAGLCSIAMVAASAQAHLRILRARLDEAAELAKLPPETTRWIDGWADAWGRIFNKIVQGTRLEDQDLRKQLRSIDRFLFDDGPPPDGLRAGPPCLVWWEPLFMHQGGLLFRLFAPGTPERVRNEFRELLAMWSTTLVAARCEELRYIGVQQPKGVLAGADTNRPTYVADRNRYVYRTVYVTGDNLADYAHYVVERSTDGVFIDPPHAKILFDERPQRFWHGTDKIEEALRLYESHGPRAIDPAVFDRIAAGTGLSRTAAALVWLGALQPWDEDVPKQLRKQIGAKVAELKLAIEELRGSSIDKAYTFAMPERPSDLLTDAGVDTFIRAWNEVHGKQAPLPMERVEQLEVEMRGAPISAAHAVRVLADVNERDHFSKDARWVVRPYQPFASQISYRRGWIPAGWPKPEAMGQEEDVNSAAVFDGRVLRFYLRYIPWAYQDLPVGDPMRANVAEMAARIGQRLANPDLLLLAGAIDLSRQPNEEKVAQQFHEIVDRFRAPAYRAVDGGASAPGFDRGDLVVTWPTKIENGVFFAFRPNQVRDAAAIEKLAEDLGVADLFTRQRRGCACGLNFGNYDTVDLTNLSEWLVWSAPEFQALVADLQHPRIAHGRYVADPRASRPDLVEAARKKHDLSEDAATLWLQILTLAEPTPARVQRINGWDRGAHDAAGDELLRRKLVVEAKHPRTTRTMFLRGDVILPKMPAAPIETSKAALYDVDATSAPVFGVLLPIAPLPELFGEAWNAVR